MKKRVAIAILSCGILTTMPTYAATMNGIDTSAETTLEFTNGTVEFVGYDIIKDYNGNDVIAMQFDFTNTSSESEMPQSVFGMQVFQDSGIEADYATINDENWSKLTNNSSKTITSA